MARGLYRTLGPVGDQMVSFVAEAPDYTAGDAQFLDPARPHDVQLRPILASERTPRATGTYPAGVRFLGWRSPSTGQQLRAVVDMAPSRRDNTPQNVRYAIREVAKFDAAYGQLFEQARQGVDLFAL